MSDISNKTIKQLRAEGYLVITWTPEEVGKANFNVSRDQIIEFGNNILYDQNEDCDEE